jgi:hypothetical protein
MMCCHTGGQGKHLIYFPLLQVKEAVCVFKVSFFVKNEF